MKKLDLYQFLNLVGAVIIIVVGAAVTAIVYWVF